MKTYRVEIVRSADRHIQKLPKADKKRILETIDKLASNPRPFGYKELVGFKGIFRIRSGNYRIIYTVIDDILLVTVLDVPNRRDAY